MARERDPRPVPEQDGSGEIGPIRGVEPTLVGEVEVGPDETGGRALSREMKQVVEFLPLIRRPLAEGSSHPLEPGTGEGIKPLTIPGDLGLWGDPGQKDGRNLFLTPLGLEPGDFAPLPVLWKGGDEDLSTGGGKKLAGNPAEADRFEGSEGPAGGETDGGAFSLSGRAKPDQVRRIGHRREHGGWEILLRCVGGHLANRKTPARSGLRHVEAERAERAGLEPNQHGISGTHGGREAGQRLPGKAVGSALDLGLRGGVALPPQGDE